MRRYLLSSSLIHFSLILLFFLIGKLMPEPNIIWLEGAGFDFNGGGGGTGGSGGKTGDTAKMSLKEAKRGQVVPKPVQVPIPNKPAPVQKEQRGEQEWSVKSKDKKKTPAKKTTQDTNVIQRGDRAQKEQSNIIRRGVKDGSVAGTGDFDFGEGTGDGTGLPVGVGFGPGGGSGFGFGSYLGILRKRIWAEWTQYTAIGSDKSCVVGLTVSKRGQVSNIKLEESSGDAFFDNVAKRATRNSAPLPPLPSGFPKSEQRFRIKFQLVD